MLRASLRSALVTGAARRIGRAIALGLARRGWSVAVHYHAHGEEAEAVAAEIRALGARAATLAADLTREDQTSTLVARSVQAIGPLGLLVNNASTFEPDRIDTVTRELWDLHLETNLRAPFVLLQDFARQLPEDERGNVVNLIDQRVWNLTPSFMSYTISKAALWTLTRTAAMALAPRIRVNAIGPGPTLRSARQSEEDFERQWGSTPLERGATPEEIAETVGFLIDRESMTGQMIALDGGQHLGSRTARRPAARE